MAVGTLKKFLLSQIVKHLYFFKKIPKLMKNSYNIFISSGRQQKGEFRRNYSVIYREQEFSHFTDSFYT